MKYTRPRFDELEVSFMLEILKEVEASINRQILSFQEEQKHLESNVYALRHKMIYETPYPTYFQLKEEKQKLAALQIEWLPLRRKETVVLSRLVARLEKILQHRRGRIPSTLWDSFYTSYLEEIVPKNT